MNPRIVAAIFWKDFLDAIRNAYILVSLILPVGMSLLFGLFLPGGGNTALLTVAVYDPGHSRLVQSLGDNPTIGISAVGSVEEVAASVNSGTSAGLVLAADFDTELAAGKTPPLSFYYSSSQNSALSAAIRQVVERELRAEAGQDLPAKITSIDVNEGGRRGQRRNV